MALRYQRAEMDYLAAVADNVSKMIEGADHFRLSRANCLASA